MVLTGRCYVSYSGHHNLLVQRLRFILQTTTYNFGLSKSTVQHFLTKSRITDLVNEHPEVKKRRIRKGLRARLVMRLGQRGRTDLTTTSFALMVAMISGWSVLGTPRRDAYVIS